MDVIAPGVCGVFGYRPTTLLNRDYLKNKKSHQNKEQNNKLLFLFYGIML